MFSYIKYFLVFAALSLFADLNFTNLTIITGNTSVNQPQITDSNPQIITDASGKYVYAIWETNAIQTVRSTDYGLTWTKPKFVTGDVSPNLSQAGLEAKHPRIITNANGKYIYAIWQIKNENCWTIQTARSADFGDTWTNPIAVTGDALPALSQSKGDAYFPQITADASGQYIYAIWTRHNKSNFVVQIARSSDFGKTWTNPEIATGDEKSPNLSITGQNADTPQIVTDASGRYVYAIWKRNNEANSVIQIVKSSDYGNTWTNPIAVTGNEPPNLSQDKKMASQPKIAADASGKYVYVIWKRYNGMHFVIQTVRSFDFGNSWTNPIAIPGNLIPDLTQSGKNADSPKIAADASGRYVYAIWIRSNGSNWIVQTVKSSDYGITWTYPALVTGDIPPNLSQDIQNAMEPQITADANGRFVYAIWKRYTGTDTIIESAVSPDCGVTWTNLTNATGSPLFQEGVHSCKPQITTDATGKYVYVLWEGRNKNMIIQSVNGINFSMTLKLLGSQIKINSPFQIELSNKISWNNIAQAVKYRIYTDDNLTNPLAEISAPNLQFFDHRIKFGISKTYYVTWVNKNGQESAPAQITMP